MGEGGLAMLVLYDEGDGPESPESKPGSEMTTALGT